MCAAELKQDDNNDNNDNNDQNAAKFFEIGKYRFEWECDISTQKTLIITATETITKDIFSSQYSLEELKAMKWFKPQPIEIKHFIEEILFNNTNEMFYRIGFIDKNNEDEGGYNDLRINKYTENDKILIILHYQNKHINNKWELALDFVPQTTEVKLENIVRDLQYENQKLMKQNQKWVKQMEVMKENVVPKGTIVMWSGSIHNIPKGWQLCDGQHNTPDLRDRFVLGGGGEYKIGNKGGNYKHTHNVSVGSTKLKLKHMPQHQHHIKRDYWDVQSGGGGNKYRVLCANKDGDRNIYTDYVGGGEAHDHPSYCTYSENFPPFITLGFIMKT